MVYSTSKILKNLIVVLLFVLLRYSSYAQSEKDSTHFFKQAVFTEAFGQAEGLFSINYERRVGRLWNWGFITARSGIGYFPGDSLDGGYKRANWSFPFVASCYLGRKHHFITIGAGYTIILTHYFVDSIPPIQVYKPYEDEFTFEIGYCYYGNNGLLFQIYPMIQFSSLGHSTNTSYYLFGFSLGLGWNKKAILK